MDRSLLSLIDTVSSGLDEKNLSPYVLAQIEHHLKECERLIRTNQPTEILPETHIQGQRLKKARRDAGLSAMEVAARLGITRQAVHNYEKGASRPSDPLKILMARLYGTSVAELFFRP